MGDSILLLPLVQPIEHVLARVHAHVKGLFFRTVERPIQQDAQAFDRRVLFPHFNRLVIGIPSHCRPTRTNLSVFLFSGDGVLDAQGLGIERVEDIRFSIAPPATASK